MRCPLFSFSKFKTLDSSHSWSCPPCCVPASSRDSTSTSTVPSSSAFSNLYTSTVQPGSSGLSSADATLLPTLAFKLLILLPPISHLLPLHPATASCSLLFSYTFCFLFPLTRSGFFNRMLKVSVRAALSYYTYARISSHPVNLICIQESNLNLSSSFPILGFFDLRFDCTNCRSDIVSPDDQHARGGVIIFVRKNLSLSKLSISSLSSLDLYSNYVGINISLNNFSSFSFPNIYALPIRSSLTDSKTDFLFPPFYFFQKSPHRVEFQLPSLPQRLKRYF